MTRTGLLIASLGLFIFVQTAQADWSAAQRLTWTAGDSNDPAVAVDSSGAIHVVWSDNTLGNQEIFFKTSTDGGANWSAASRLTWTSGKSCSPAIAIGSGGALHVVWYDETSDNRKVFYKRSTDGGANWSAARMLAGTVGGSWSPDIAIYSINAIHVVWYGAESGYPEIYYRRSLDGGTNWSATKRLTWASRNCLKPALALDSTGGIHVVWYDYLAANSEIYYRRSTDGGTTWSQVQRLTWTSGGSFDPAIAVDSNDDIHVVWDDETPGTDELYYKSSGDGGATWSVIKRLTWTSGSSFCPVITLDSSNNIYVTWHDATPGNWEIYYKTGADGGTTWSAAQRLTWTSGSSLNPAQDRDPSGFIHVVWSESTTGNMELYYKKGN